MQNESHYTVLGNSRSSIWCHSKASMRLPSLIVTYILSCTVSKILRIIGQIFAFNSSGGTSFLTIFRSEHLNSGQKKLETGNIALLYYSTKFISILIPM